MSVSFGDPNYETEDVLKVRGITKSYDGRRILQDVTFNVHNGERVAILGDNGAGKTTLLRIILGDETADEGVIKKGQGLRPAYLPQQVHFANEGRNLIDTLIYDKNVTMQTARNRLGAFRFSGEDQLKIVRTLSGGESGSAPSLPAPAGTLRKRGQKPDRHPHLRQKRHHADRPQPSGRVPLLG